MNNRSIDILNEAVNMKKRGEGFVIATIVQGEEGSPGRTGFKVIVFEDGTFKGTVGGGKMEKLILEKCSEINRTGKAGLETLHLTEKGIGMACGGYVKVFYEYFPATKTVYIFGAGHICKSISPILKTLSFKVVIIDNRPEFAKAESLPSADEVICLEYEEYLATFAPQNNDAVIIITHGHKYDARILDTICQQDLTLKYLGMIGSKVKVDQIKDLIKQNGYAGNLIEQLYAPIGLNVARRTTEEIAIAIVAEMLAVYNEVEEIKNMSRK